MKEDKFISTSAENGEKEVITLKELKQRLDGYYYDVELAIEAIKNGQTVRTSFYFYEKTK